MAQRNQGSFSKCVPPALPFKPGSSATIKLTHYPEPISWAGRRPSRNNRHLTHSASVRLSSADPSAERFAPYHCLSRAMTPRYDEVALRRSGRTRPRCFGRVPYLFRCRTRASLPTCTLVAPPAEESPSTVGQARATDTLTVVDQLRPSDEDIVKAFRRATEDRQPVEVQDAALDTDEPATAGPVPLKKAPAAARP